MCLPLYSFRVPAGFPSPAQDHIEAEISLDELLDLRAPHMYLVRISGDSMINAGMFDGDLAIVNRAMEGRKANRSFCGRRTRPTRRATYSRGMSY